MSKRSVGLSEPVYQEILKQIMNKELMPGDKIPELKIAEEFHISRTPVRDAIKMLGSNGLVDIYPNRFAQIREYTTEEIVEVGTLRVSLDVMAVKLAALYGSRADYLQLLEIAEKCTQAFEQGNDAEKRRLDGEFHLKLAEISGNELLMKFQKELCLKVQFIMLHHPNSVENELGHLREHYGLAEALMDHDEEKALKIIIAHLTSFYGLRKRYPQGFFDITF